MAKQYHNKKGFLVIKMTIKEALQIWGKYGGVGICDSCNSMPEDGGYFVACLNWFMCPECFKFWLRKAEHFREDESYETMQYENAVALLKRAGLWSSER